MEIVLGALSGLLGVIVGGVLQYFTSQRAIERQHKWDRSRLIHEKLELIAQEASDMGQRMSKLYLGAIARVEDRECYRPEITLPFAKLEMLLSFYGPELTPEYDRLLALRNEMGSILVDLSVGNFPTVKKDKQDLNAKLINAGFKAEKICEGIITEASKLGREHLDLKAERCHSAEARSSRG